MRQYVRSQDPSPPAFSSNSPFTLADEVRQVSSLCQPCPGRDPLCVAVCVCVTAQVRTCVRVCAHARACVCVNLCVCVSLPVFQFSTPRSHNHQGNGIVRGHVTPLFGCGILLPFPCGFPQLRLRTRNPGVARLLAASTLPGEGPPVEGGGGQVGRGATPLRGILVGQSTRSVSTQPTVIFPNLRTPFLSDFKNIATNATDDLAF